MPAPSRAWPDLVFADEADAASVSSAVKRGALVRVARGVYSGDRSSRPADVVWRHLWQIVGHEFPGAVIADRSVRTGGLGREGRLFIVHRSQRPIALPGVVVYPRPGHRAIQGDVPLPGKIWMSSTERALLDNLVPQRRSNTPRCTMRGDEIEDWIRELLRQRGDVGLKELRDRAQAIAKPLGRTTQMGVLDRLIDAALFGPENELSDDGWLEVDRETPAAVDRETPAADSAGISPGPRSELATPAVTIGPTASA